MKRNVLVIFLMVVCLRANGYALYDPAEIPVLYVPASARAGALGNSLYCAEDEGGWYNPSYLAALERGSFYGTYGLFQRGTKYTHASLQMTAASLGWCAGFSDVSSSFDHYSGPDSGSLGTVSVSQSLVSLAAGLRGSDRDFLLGLAARAVIDKIDAASSFAYGLDVGGGYILNPRVRLGLVVKNALSLHERSEDKLLQETVLAMSLSPSLRFQGQDDDTGNAVFVAASKRVTGNPRIMLGWESVLYRVLAFRLGYDRDVPVTGFGITYPLFRLDVAAVFKAQGPLYFMTAGVMFGAFAKTAPPTQAREASEKPEVSAAHGEDRSEHPRALTEEGWRLLKDNRLAEALERFNAALELDPQWLAAAQGRAAVQQEIEKKAKKESVDRALARGWKALDENDLLLAEKTFRFALKLDPENRNAKDGIIMAVETAGDRLKERLSDYGGLEESDTPLDEEDALEISRSGTFPRLVASLALLDQKKDVEAYAEWLQVQPRESAFVKKYDGVFGVIPARQFEACLAKASRLSTKGLYLEAVRELERSFDFQGLTPEQVQRVKGLVASYTYVGSEMSKSFIEAARSCMDEKQDEAAAGYLERAIKCGYGADEARRLLAEIKTRRNNESPSKSGRTKGTEGDTPGSRPQPKKSSAIPAPPKAKPEAPAGRLTPIQEELLRDYQDKARELYEERRYRECREYLVRILYLDPGNEEAKRYLKEVDRVLK